MPRLISASDVEDRLSSWIDYANEAGDEVIVESYGKPKAVLMSISDFEEVQELREQKLRAEAIERLQSLGMELSRRRKATELPDKQQREDAVKRLRALRDEVSARDRDLTEEQIEEIANRFSRDIIDDMAAEGKVEFERDLK